MSAANRWSTTLEPGLRRVLIIKWSALGDVALATTVMDDIARELSHATLELDTLPRFAPLFEHDPRFDTVLDVNARAPGAGGMLRWLSRVARTRYDAVIDLQSTDRSRLLLGALVLAGRAPRIRVGTHRHWPYTCAPPVQPREVHALEHLRATLRACGIEPRAQQPVLYPGPEHLARTASLTQAHGLESQRYALLMPGCHPAGRLKRWGWRRFAALAAALHRRGVHKVVLVGTHDEREECDAIEKAYPRIAVNLCGATEVLDLVPLASNACCVVSNDTGTAHVAAAAGVPMVIVCGPTDPRRVRPAGRRVRMVQAPLWCRNCYRKECSHHACMEVLDPCQVMELLDELQALPGD